MSGSTGGIMTMTAPHLDGAPVPPPPITQKMFIELHPTVIEKDNSIHSEHGVVHYPFWFGGLASCVSSCCTQPLGPLHSNFPNDMLTRSSSVCRRSITTLRSWLSASLTRTFFYSGVRFGMYEKLKEMGSTSTHAPSGLALALMAASSGFTGSVCSNFADVVCLRMQADPGLPPELRRNYKNIADGVYKMVRAEGWNSIWTGVWLGAGRAAIGTATQLAGYDIIKRELMKRTSLGDNIPTHITASCLAGFLSTFICSPLDVFKARFMTRKSSAHSMSVMLQSTLKNEGAAWMFKGLTPALISRAPSTIITFVTLEQLRKVYRHMHGLQE
ncbi:mitochondrial carrier [Aureobasidium pullulans EXF-150]|uniref:Mitochondrial carrier n=1 Tax=Aureobasidium pullulans EXF-150 TaxID=1043002 RepID=A0A074XGF7_AURPU|nr:mitochondrial carrier [Aureobasidium pullulans EXF-150]KEQ84595.1 mitochondrial carrier [Aureobasidium pullulans EXF-150]